MPIPNRPQNFLVFFMSLILFACFTYAADPTPPTTTITLDPSEPNGKNDWYVTPVEVTLSATDLGSGVDTINYRIDASPWESTDFSNTLNLAPNPSMEDVDGAITPPIKDWPATVLDADTTYSRDTSEYAPSYSTTSAKISTTGTGWHGINNQSSFSAAAPLSNMSASVWLKTESVLESAYFKVYVVSDDGTGLTYTYLDQSGGTTGTAGWSKLTVDFVVNDATAVGVYLDIGLTGSGTVWADAVSITATSTSAITTFTIGTNGQHTIEYYATDNSGNIESHSCTSPTANCESLKIDQNAPGSWYDAGAVRGTGPNDHELFVFTNVQDGISGISDLSNKYMYHVDTETGFGRFTELSFCNTPWLPDTWVDLASDAFNPGDEDVQLKTQKTDFCNSDWKICKTVRFYAEDMAGNWTTKDFCLNGPWIEFIGGGTVKSNGGIDMIAEPEGDNADGLIEVGNNLVSFFATSTGWRVESAPESKAYDYNKWLSQVKPNPTTITALNTTTGVYKISGNHEFTNQNVPNSYNSATFTQIVFIDGNLKISRNISVSDSSAALLVVNGDVQIAKGVDIVGVAIFADGDFYTAYNITEGQTANTLLLKGVFAANKFNFQRTLQGTQNEKYPSEQFTFEPKYAIKIADYMGTNSIKWISTN